MVFFILHSNKSANETSFEQCQYIERDAAQYDEKKAAQSVASNVDGESPFCFSIAAVLSSLSVNAIFIWLRRQLGRDATEREEKRSKNVTSEN